MAYFPALCVPSLQPPECWPERLQATMLCGSSWTLNTALHQWMSLSWKLCSLACGIWWSSFPDVGIYIPKASVSWQITTPTGCRSEPPTTHRWNWQGLKVLLGLGSCVTCHLLAGRWYCPFLCSWLGPHLHPWAFAHWACTNRDDHITYKCSCLINLIPCLYCSGSRSLRL